ncbi:MAG: 2,3-bisphosphoglycerate-independent phosphoglycerate mutase [Pyrinomonadaceae bacterium]
MNNNRPLALIILDGWGISAHRDGNAIALAHTPNYDEICESFPSTTLAASGRAMGLPPGEAGDAEIGHRIMGAGRIVQPDAARIATQISNGQFLANETLRSALGRAASDGRPVHFIGLLGDGGVHSSQETLFALLRMAKMSGVPRAFVHAILDGRDVGPRTADVYVDALQIKMADIGIGSVASLCGRFYAMDSGENWERTARAFTMLVHGEGERARDAVTAVRASFLRGISDEFISPIVIEKASDEPLATVNDGDLVVFFNHKGDGMLQLVRSLASLDDTSPKPRIEAVCLTEYGHDLGLPVAFRHAEGEQLLADVFTSEGITNYRITESPRSQHVSAFFNGRTAPSDPDIERHIFVQASRADTLEAGPESASFKLADTAIRGMGAGGGKVFVVNLPAPAMLAATGNLEKAVESVQFVDTCLGGIIQKSMEMNGVAIVTASHGGCEDMAAAARGDSGRAAQVPFHLIDPERPGTELLPGGSLADIAPTMLGICGIKPPSEMTGRDLRIL